jgi:hypothetical protein
VHATEPVLGVARAQRHRHGVTDPVGGEHQVLSDLVFAQADVAHAVVAHEGRSMAVQAVVGEQLGPVLQRGHVGHALLRELVPRDAADGSLGTGDQRQAGQQPEDQFLHGVVAFGLGLDLNAGGRSRGRARP